MSIQYAGGTIVNATLTQAAGTRAELAQWVRDQLVAAGWTSSGSATDYQVTSATTPQGLACRARVYDPGSGSCARLKMSNPSGLKVQVQDLFLLPAAAKVWRIIANKYQFFVMTAGVSGAREFVCGGVPYMPPFLSGAVTECIWSQGNAYGDTDATVGSTVNSFRTKMHTRSPCGNWWHVINGTIFENPGFNNVNGIGVPRLVLSVGGNLSDGAATAYRWHDDSIQAVEPLIAWGLSASTDEGKIRGQLWDSAIVTDSFAPDTTITLDSRTYYAITGSNAGSVSDGRGTLFVAVT